MLTYSLFFCKRKPLISKDVGKEHRSCRNLCSLELSFSSLTCRKCASTMFMYMSSSSLPLPMKHRCSPLAMEPDSKDCFWASRRDFTERANSEGFWSICEKKGKCPHYFHVYIHILYSFKHRSNIVCSHQVGVQMKCRGQVPRVVLLCRPTIHHKETDPILKIKSIITTLSFAHMAKLTEGEYFIPWLNI